MREITKYHDTSKTVKERAKNKLFGAVYSHTREFDTLKSKKVPQSLEIGLFFCQIFIFII